MICLLPPNLVYLLIRLKASLDHFLSSQVTVLQQTKPGWKPGFINTQQYWIVMVWKSENSLITCMLDGKKVKWKTGWSWFETLSILKFALTTFKLKKINIAIELQNRSTLELNEEDNIISIIVFYSNMDKYFCRNLYALFKLFLLYQIYIGLFVNGKERIVSCPWTRRWIVSWIGL